MAATEKVFVATPTPTLGRRAIAAPVEFYSTGEDNLRVISVNSMSGVSLKVNARLVTSDGTIDSASWDHTPNANRTAKTTDFPLAPGAVLNLAVFAGAGAPLIGQTFVIVQLIRGLGSAAVVLGVLCSGYVTPTQCLAWPGSPIVSSTEGEPAVRAILGSTPALGAVISETVPVGARWELLTLLFAFSTGAGGNSRIPFFTPVMAGLALGVYLGSLAIAALSTAQISFGPLLGQDTGGFNTIGTSALPARIILPPGASFTINAVNLQANDQFSAPNYLVREWLEVG